ncbi:restriction endonuclease subunit S [Hymenobacter sp. BT664]|uniref:Restriction endonuclease subunit S n=1 Tax=Hymenobacter montanus TaxID=2771359 RepID=A0A927BDS4_9BACT|nr:restriction endonuclease subunit S [Hymenobacter montanus]MBD2768541.1 restriction endonuclease subunit S [Hymenobacter montanus]
MANEWPVVTIGDIADTKKNALVGGPFGSNLVSKDYVKEGVPVIRGQNMGSRQIGGDFVFVTEEKAQALAANTARPGDLIFTQRGTLGQVALVPHGLYDTYIVSQSQMKLTPDPQKVDSLFLYYIFSSPEQLAYIDAHAIKVGVPHTNLGILRNTPVILPPLAEQRRIAHILGTLDDKIELNSQLNATLEQLARTLFQSWFVDFDPVRAKASGEPEDSICRRLGLMPELLALFPAALEDSAMGEIPVGWKIKTVEELAKRVAMGPFGSSIKVSTFVPEGVPVISGQHLRTFMLEDSSFNFVTEEHAQQLNKAAVQRGDIVFTHAGSIGQVALIPNASQYDRYILSQRQFFLRPDTTVTSANYLIYHFSSDAGQHQILANTSSSGVPSIARPVSYLRSIKMLSPDKSTLDAFDDFITPIHSLIETNRAEMKNLAVLRDELLPKLLSGEIRLN